MLGSEMDSLFSLFTATADAMGEPLERHMRYYLSSEVGVEVGAANNHRLLGCS